MNPGEKLLCEWQLRMTGGFFTKLFELMTVADDQNFARLSAGFPLEAQALWRFKNEDGYWPQLLAEYNLTRVLRKGTADAKEDTNTG